MEDRKKIEDRFFSFTPTNRLLPDSLFLYNPSRNLLSIGSIVMLVSKLFSQFGNVAPCICFPFLSVSLSFLLLWLMRNWSVFQSPPENIPRVSIFHAINKIRGFRFNALLAINGVRIVDGDFICIGMLEVVSS